MDGHSDNASQSIASPVSQSSLKLPVKVQFSAGIWLCHAPALHFTKPDTRDKSYRIFTELEVTKEKGTYKLANGMNFQTLNE